MHAKFRDWHVSTIEKVRKARSSNTGTSNTGPKKGDIEMFPGFKPAIEACALTWDDYPIPGVTYSAKDGSRFYYHFGSSKPHDSESKKPSRVQPITICSQDIISTDNPNRNIAHSQRSQETGGSRGRAGDCLPSLPSRRDSGHDGAMSSGSEGFCEPERGFRDSDSSGDYKGAHSRSNSFEEVESPHSYILKQSIPNSSQASPSILGNMQLARKQSLVEVSLQDVNEANLDMSLADMPSSSNPENSSVVPPLPGSGVCPASTEPASSAGAAAAVAPVFSGTVQTPVQAQADSPEGTQGSNEVPETQHSSDAYQIYFYDTKVKTGEPDKKKKDKGDEPNVFAGLKSADNMQDVS